MNPNDITPGMTLYVKPGAPATMATNSSLYYKAFTKTLLVSGVILHGTPLAYGSPDNRQGCPSQLYALDDLSPTPWPTEPQADAPDDGILSRAGHMSPEFNDKFQQVVDEQAQEGPWRLEWTVETVASGNTLKEAEVCRLRGPETDIIVVHPERTPNTTANNGMCLRLLNAQHARLVELEARAEKTNDAIADAYEAGRKSAAYDRQTVLDEVAQYMERCYPAAVRPSATQKVIDAIRAGNFDRRKADRRVVS